MEERPGGEWAIIDGSKSRCLPESRGGSGALVMSAAESCIGGSSMDDLGMPAPSLSECQSFHSN